MIPILAGLLSTLATNGLGLLVDAISTKGKEYVEDTIGVKIPDDSSKLTPDMMVKLKELEIKYEEVLQEGVLKAKELELQADKLAVDNTKSARDMNTSIQTSANSSHIAKNAPYYLDFIIVGSTILLSGFLFFVGVPVENEKLTYMVLGSILTLCGTIINFHRGTSASSKNKDDTISALTKGGK